MYELLSVDMLSGLFVLLEIKQLNTYPLYTHSIPTLYPFYTHSIFLIQAVVVVVALSG